MVRREWPQVFDLDIEQQPEDGLLPGPEVQPPRRARARRRTTRAGLLLATWVPSASTRPRAARQFVRCVDVQSQTAHRPGRGQRAALTASTPAWALRCANVLEYLPELARDRKRLREEGGPFDLIVLDPPAFTKSAQGTVRARHASGYREINYRSHEAAPARRLPGHVHVASHFMTTELLKQRNSPTPPTRQTCSSSRSRSASRRRTTPSSGAHPRPTTWTSSPSRWSSGTTSGEKASPSRRAGAAGNKKGAPVAVTDAPLFVRPAGESCAFLARKPGQKP